jgi:3-deoxy-manno-octulosonate cytidylyltransferase (CMP-KDO synthetase)
MKTYPILGVIPSRWGSRRFPGKGLADIGGKPMLWHVYQRCKEAQCLNEIVIATDDKRIATACMALGMPVMMTRDDHHDCLDRMAEVTTKMKHDWLVCIQGDEPFVSPIAIRKITEATMEGQMPVCGCAKLTDPRDLVDTSVIKVVRTMDSCALYLSRSPIPYPQRRTVHAYFQVCVYGFHRHDILQYHNMPPGPVECAESVGLLRWIEHGYDVRMVDVPPSPVSVDTQADLVRAQSIYAERTAK